MTRHILIIGGGIVGTALTAELATVDGAAVTVIEQGPAERLPGSTGHAPGYVGILGDAPVLTELARASTAIYDDLRFGGLPGFNRVGAIEVATSAHGQLVLERRVQMARDAHLPAHLIDPAEAVMLAPDLIAGEHMIGALHFPADGTARASTLTAALRAKSEEAGVRYLNDQSVVGIELAGDRVTAVRTRDSAIPADDVVVAAGVWSPAIMELIGYRLPLVPVEHPYVYGPPRARNRARSAPSPFVRWPEQHVYARDHGARFGLGTYDHRPRPVGSPDLGDRAEHPWPGAIFDDAIARARNLLPSGNRFAVDLRLNGIFAMTPDNLPFLGSIPDMQGMWLAAAIWITHAAGAARTLAELMTGQPASVRDAAALRPDRFAGQAPADLERRALQLYRNIYATS